LTESAAAEVSDDAAILMAESQSASDGAEEAVEAESAAVVVPLPAAEALPMDDMSNRTTRAGMIIQALKCAAVLLIRVTKDFPCSICEVHADIGAKSPSMHLTQKKEIWLNRIRVAKLPAVMSVTDVSGE
jgi:hypothetical protein